MSTKEAKITFGSEGDTPLTNESDLLKALSSMKKSFPLLNDNNELNIKGELGKTGVVVLSKGRFSAAVRSPVLIPKTIGLEGGSVIFGKPADERMIEPSLEIPMGEQQAAQVASMVLIDLRRGFDSRLVSMANSGFAAIGSEPEAWIIDPQTGDLEKISGGELQEGLLEETLPPLFNPTEFLKERAQYSLERAKKFPSYYLLDTSVLPTSDLLKPKINVGHDLGPYVFAMQHFLKKNAFNYSDLLAETVFEAVIKRFGISSHQELKETTNNMAYWVMAASHASVGLPHLRQKASEIFVPAEIAIAVSDVFNSDLATIAELLMFSTPMIYGVGPIETEINNQNQEVWPRDYRAILRYLMDTTNPSPFIGNYEEMVKRISYAIINGLTHTADRASFITEVNGKTFAVMHGRVRNRICSSEPKNQTGRVEFTGCGASPSYYDELARNCFLQIMSVAALEAVENQQTPMEYWGRKYPYLASWKKQKRLLQQASLFGFKQEEIKTLIDESIRFINEVVEDYPSLGEIGEIAVWRISNLLNPPVSSLDEYVKNPQGPISEVIQNEIKRGITPINLAQKIHKFQLDLSNDILFKLSNNV